MARDEAELRDWINEARANGVEPHEDDAWLASVVRRLANERRLADEPYFRYKRTQWAVEKAIEAGVARIREGSEPEASARRTKERDRSVAPFWNALLSPSKRVTPRRRLEAFTSLDDLGVLPRCTCDRDEGQFEEEKYDAFRAYLVRSVGQRHYRAAYVIAEFPETFHAVRDAIDAKVSADEQAEDDQDSEDDGGTIAD